MWQLDFISLLSASTRPPSLQKQSPTPAHKAFQAHDVLIEVPRVVDHTHSAFLSTAATHWKHPYLGAQDRGPQGPLRLTIPPACSTGNTMVMGYPALSSCSLHNPGSSVVQSPWASTF